MNLTITGRAAAFVALLACDGGAGVHRPKSPVVEADAGGGGGEGGGGALATGGEGGQGGSIPEPEAECSDGLDDDGDGLVDCDDPDCLPESTVVDDLAEQLAAHTYVPGSRKAMLVYAARGGKPGSRRLAAVPLGEDGLPSGEPHVVHESKAATFRMLPRTDGGVVLVTVDLDAGRVEAVLVDAAGRPESTAELETDSFRRPLISAALERNRSALAVLRQVDDKSMEIGWFSLTGEPLQAWRSLAIYEHLTARLVSGGDEVFVLQLPTFPDDAADGRIFSIASTGGYHLHSLPDMRASCVPLVPVEGEIVFHCQGQEVLSGGHRVDGPELVRVALDGKLLERIEVPQPKGKLPIVRYTGSHPAGVVAMYPWSVAGKQVLMLTRAPSDLSTVTVPTPLRVPGQPRIVHFEELPEEDRVTYIAPRGGVVLQRRIPARCR